MRETSTYKLNQWDKTDRIQMEDFNKDNAKVEAALAELNARTGTLEGAMPRLGNCQVYTTTYVGNGTKSRTLTFAKAPLAVFISGERALGGCLWQSQMIIVFWDATVDCTTTWSVDGRSMTWEYNSSEHMLNASGKTYRVTAIAAAG